MKSSTTTYAAAIVLTLSLMVATAQAKGGHSMGSSMSNRSSNSFSSRSSGMLAGNKLATGHNVVSPTGNQAKLSQFGNSGKQGSLKNLKLKEAGHGPVKIGGKKPDKFFGKNKYWPGKFWCGFGCGWYGCGDWYGCDYWPSYCWSNPCCEVYYGSCEPGLPGIGDGPDFGPQGADDDSTDTPAAKAVHIVNPADTKATLGFAVNGQSYTLPAGKSQDVEIADGATIEFDRGVEDQTGRYSLTPGEYHFASTPKGWELYRSGGAAAEGVASN